MAKLKASAEIGNRLADELLRMFPNETIKGICKKVGADRRALSNWRRGDVPSTIYLQRLHYLGGDVIYVLTGKRHVLVKSLTVHGAGGTRKMKWNGEAFEEEW